MLVRCRNRKLNRGAALNQSEAFVVDEKMRFVRSDWSSKTTSHLILPQLGLGVVRPKLKRISIQHVIAEIFVERSVKFVRAGLRDYIQDATARVSKIRGVSIRQHLDLGDRLYGRMNGNLRIDSFVIVYA